MLPASLGGPQGARARGGWWHFGVEDHGRRHRGAQAQQTHQGKTPQRQQPPAQVEIFCGRLILPTCALPASDVAV